MKPRPGRIIFLVPALLFVLSATGLQTVDAHVDDKDLFHLIEEAGDAAAYPGSSQVIVFDRTVADVQDTGLTYVDQEKLWKVLTRRGGRDLRAVTFNYDPLSAKIEVREARILRKDGSIERIPLDTVIDYPAPARAIYWGAREIIIPVGRLEPGDALYVKTFRKGFTYALLGEDGSIAAADVDDDERYIPPMRGHFYDIVQFWSGTPIKEKSYTALVPRDKTLQFEVYNGEVTCAVHPKGDKMEYIWAKRDIKPFKGEPNSVAASDVATKLLVSTSPDWQAKSLWFHGVNEDYGSFEWNDEIKAKVDEIVKDCKTDAEKVHELTHWVANEIRYSGISMGPGEGYTLHSGEMNFRDRCGVCKDKAGMLITMLRAAGFDSYPAMTMAGSRIDYIPADQFNHCVTILKHAEGDYQLLDPTWVPFVRELWSSAEQQQNYLMGVPEGSDLCETPISPPENHYFRIKGKSRLYPCGTLKGAFTLTAEGQSDARVRRAFVRGYKALWRSYFEKAMHAISPRTVIDCVDYNDPYDLSEPFTARIEYTIPKYAIVTEGKILFTPCVARFPFSDGGTSYFMTIDIDRTERKYGFKTRCSRLLELDETIDLPDGYAVKDFPEYDRVDGTAASFEGGYRVDGEGHLVYDATLVLKKRVYEASDHENFRKAVRGVKKMKNNSVLLGR